MLVEKKLLNYGTFVCSFSINSLEHYSNYYLHCRLLSQAFSSRYFCWTSGDPHRSGFKSHTAVLSVLCVMFQVQLLCSESIECFPDISSQFFLKLLVTIPVAPIIIGIIVHFRFHIRCISIHKLLYFNFFSPSFCTTLLLLLLLLLLFLSHQVLQFLSVLFKDPVN